MFAVKFLGVLTIAGETVYKPTTRMQNELDVIRDVTDKFRAAGIDYMLTGSVAMTYYARPRMTQDIDLVVALEAKDVDRVTALFETDYYVDRQAVSRAIANSALFNIIHNQALIKVDCIVRKGTEYRLLEFERRQAVSLQGIKVWIVSKEDLIISKLYWARGSHSEFQLRDVRNLLAAGYDGAYVAEWARKLGVHDLLEACLSE